MGPYKSSAGARTPPPVETSPPPITPPKSLTRTVTTSGNPQSLSPRKAANSLSDIFSFGTGTTTAVCSRASSKPQTSVARRMLGRSRTESSIISISSASDADHLSAPATPKKLRAFVSDSVVGSPSSRAQSQSPSKAKSSDDVSSPPVRPSLANSNIKTYAGKSRSFLVAIPPSQAASMGMDASLMNERNAMLMDSQEDDFEVRESYTELRQRWGIDASEDDPRPSSPQHSPSPKRKGKAKGLPRQEEPIRLLPNGMINDLKSITELRSKGETRRFLDEVGYLFEGLEPHGPLGVRRGRSVKSLHGILPCLNLGC